jgi:hypothetical protein
MLEETKTAIGILNSLMILEEDSNILTNAIDKLEKGNKEDLEQSEKMALEQLESAKKLLSDASYK